MFTNHVTPEQPAQIAPQHVGVDLHHHRVLFGDAARHDDALHGNTVLPEVFDDHTHAVGGGLDPGAVKFLRFGAEGKTEHHARKVGVHEHAAIAVLPVESKQAAFPGGKFFGFFTQKLMDADAAPRQVRDKPFIPPVCNLKLLAHIREF